MARKRMNLLLVAIVLFVVCYLFTWLPFIAPIVSIPIGMILGFFGNLGLYSTPSDPTIFALVKTSVCFLVIGVPILIIMMLRK